MSYNQPGPYGGPPQQQPGPYGAPPPPPPGQPGPYGQPPAAQPGYGYPQQPPQPAPGYPPQPPTAPMGFPQQQPPPYGYQQPGMPPQPPYGAQPPKKSKAGVVIAVVVAVAVVAAGGWYLVGGGSGGTIDEATKGYKLVAPETVGEFKKNPKSAPKSFSDKDRREAEAVGVKNPQQVAQKYQAGDPGNPLAAKGLNFEGVYGDIAEPEKAVDAYFALAKASTSEGSKTNVELIDTPKAMTPKGFKGAVMKCQEAKYTVNDPSFKGPKEFTLPICIWGDHSTLTMVGASDAGALLTGKKGYTLEQVADFAAQLYNTARVKI
ncbi:hypothetical protein C0216_25555 [Streptomyces globosus]|uniref:Uncharacterized protein n=2 Tax=Streptomyces TaxID=1883 RepID=A0A344UA22_9ACTN|nr:MULTISPECIES: hypothetical protein [Streptomyces]AXE27743.1 hypothetical protein C0216_25555 [Streptomyces globosus]